LGPEISLLAAGSPVFCRFVDDAEEMCMIMLCAMAQFCAI